MFRTIVVIGLVIGGGTFTSNVTTSNPMIATARAQDNASVTDANTESGGLPLIEAAVARLLEMQESDGAWPYEGVYRVQRQIPRGYRVGGTAIVCAALLDAPLPDRFAADAAIRRGVNLILEELEHPLMQPSQENTYDVRVWGHIYALDLFARLMAVERFADLNESLSQKIPWLVQAVESQELPQGGWNYANRNNHASFVTAPALQSLWVAKAQGATISDEVLQRGIAALQSSRGEKGAYTYSGPVRRGRSDQLPGSIARNVVSETTLLTLGHGDMGRLQAAIDAFHEHWDELEKRRKKTGTHEPPYGVAPYYFYYGHRYLAQGIGYLPLEKQSAEYERFDALLLKTKDEDNTWNDRVFARSAAFGTAMSILALNRQKLVPTPTAD